MLSKAPRQPARLWRRGTRGALLTLSLWLAGTGFASANETITSARFIDPTNRYPHAVLGDDIEYGGLEISVENTALPSLLWQDLAYRRTTQFVRLPLDRVFEDLEPRLADVDSDGSNEVIVVETSVHEGAQLAIYNARGEKIAATPHIGTRFRWLAPIGAADLDGDGNVEIAFIDRPHLAKTLRIWRYENGDLTEIAAIPGLTNHKIGEDFISGGIWDCGARPRLILASADWSRIIAVIYAGDWTKRDLGPLHSADSLKAALTC
ncbi:VCBS repeat-containing protein [Ruegeria sp.]|uniref:FG-GAP repeat domain-containing protein n=1 Tax=Ruegeria sp. TaxID=1879320 RepID=UPI00230886FC|nr:VCBS repeat-containing protein [Ruegeria sp.]MDA7966199.1 VCBS repeat-containing protein [Ruegeria sp.]